MTIDSSFQDIVDFLREIKLNGTRIIAQPLGFYRIFLTAKDALSEGLLLHIWVKPNQHRKSKEIDIHSHVFDMKSRLLVGELINKLYNIEHKESGNYNLVNIFHDGKEATRVVTNIKVEPVLFKEEQISAGQSYSFSSKIFHSTEIVSYPTITLMQKTNKITDHPVNIIKSEYSADEIGTYQQPDFDQEFVWNLIFDKLTV